ncbi:MAG: L-2-hydroxyglutarate oxidase [Thalassotalea sp.]
MKNNLLTCDHLIVGGGIVGLTIARELKISQPDLKIIVIDKAASSIEHGSGRNSGVIHAGFYYPADSLKAKLTKAGNQLLTQYCLDHEIAINQCGKLVVAQSEHDIDGIYELEKRAHLNGVEVEVVDEQQTAEIEANAKTQQVALWSPTTASADPALVTTTVASELTKLGVDIIYQCGFKKSLAKHRILTTTGVIIESNKLINCAGLYADKIAKSFGFSNDKVILPFKGIYLKYTGQDQPIHTNIYPVPNLKNPFLGAHFTVTVDHHIKIGPTAIPCFWRENYRHLSNFKWQELIEVLGYEAKLLWGDHFNFRQLAIEEMKKYKASYFAGLASNLVKNIDVSQFNQWTKPGIRAQLLNTETMTLEQDFIIEGDQHSLHILNAVSPAWTSSFAFAKYVVQKYLC